MTGDRSPSPTNGGTSPLRSAVTHAQRGFRSDVARLLELLDASHLLVPLARPLRDVPVGEEIELGDELSIAPHLLLDEDERRFVCAFTDGDLAREVGDRFRWTTDGADLQVCALPGMAVLDVALALVDDERVHGLVLNPLDDSELMLRRPEIASLANRTAIPLVGYVEHLPLDAAEGTLVAEPDGPPPAEVVDALERVVAEVSAVVGYRFSQTFHPERDLEPHLTLHVTARSGADYDAIAERLVADLEGKLPPPGYVDIVFEQAADGEPP